ncbi:hypothetical protein [Pedobacter sp. GR22-6]|uniref:hypothetical protein n=1 Tax=Pedobacter sp. GR22-6 TaxID=3127957 RepID=UPI00307F33EC
MKTDLIEIFQTIRAVMQPYTVQGFINRENSETLYDLWSERHVLVEGKERTEICFASLEIGKDQVLLDFMPVSGDEEIGEVFDPALLDLRKGDSSFHIKELDEKLLLHIENALANGFRIYKEKAWV